MDLLIAGDQLVQVGIAIKGKRDSTDKDVSPSYSTVLGFQLFEKLRSICDIDIEDFHRSGMS